MRTRLQKIIPCVPEIVTFINKNIETTKIKAQAQHHVWRSVAGACSQGPPARVRVAWTTYIHTWSILKTT